MATFRDILKRVESGDYDTLFGHSQRPGKEFAGIKPTEMTIREVLNFQNPRGPYGQWVKQHVGRVATPVGAYQVVGTTLRRVVDELNLNLDAKFDPDMQDIIGRYLLDARLSRTKSTAGRIKQLRAEWEGFNHVSEEELASAIIEYEKDASTFTLQG